MPDRIKPPWLSWLGVLALGLQAFLAGLGLYALAGNRFGYLQPPADAPARSASFDICAAFWAVLALLAIVGIWKNRWWAYFLELAMLLSVLLAVYWDAFPMPPEAPQKVKPFFELPYQKYLEVVMWWMGIAMLISLLFSRGVQGYKQARPSVTSEAAVMPRPYED